jgi:methionyl-tRNA formyltransferase
LAIQNKIRAFSLEPGAWTYLRGSKLKLLEAIALAEKPSANAERLLP